MNPENLKERALRFIGTSRGIRFGSFGVPSFTKGLNLKVRRSIPQELIQRISNKPQEQNLEETISTSQGLITNLGKITLNLEQTKNNLDRIVEVIQEDYKISKDQNKKEVEEYRKRIANRGRLFGKKEIADKKTGAGFDIKTYVGSFFSNSGPLKTLGALSLLNLFEAILSGDISKIVGPLLALVSVYVVPKVIGLILKQLGKRALGSLFPRAIPRGVPSSGPAVPTRSSGSPGKFFGKAALLAGGLTLGSQLLSNQNGGDVTQQRLEELTQEQKASVASSSLVPIPQDDLKKFEQLNKKFEEALDFLLKKQKEDSVKSRGSSGGGGGGGGVPGPGQIMTGPAPAEINALMSSISAAEGGLESVNKIGTVSGLSQMTIDDAIAKVEQLRAQGKTSGAMGSMQQKSQFLRERAVAAGLDPSTALFNQENQYKIDRAYLASLFSGGEQEIVNLIKSGKITDVVNKLKGVWPSLPGGAQENVHTSHFYSRFQTVLNQILSPSTVAPPSAPVLPASSGKTYPSIGGYSLLNVSPIINLIPVTSTESTSMSGVDGNDQDTPAVNTFYSGNFLSFYSKLTYQIV